MATDDLTADRMAERLRKYFGACNEGDADAIAAHFTEDAVHYFPPGMEGGPYRGASAIGKHWATLVEKVDSSWSVDRLQTDPERAAAAMEWTHFAGEDGPVLRGIEWYEFEPETGRIAEIRAYFASSMDDDRERNELVGFEYADRGYALDPPVDRE